MIDSRVDVCRCCAVLPDVEQSRWQRFYEFLFNVAIVGAGFVTAALAVVGLAAILIWCV